jgi:uncharacterized protein YuzE
MNVTYDPKTDTVSVIFNPGAVAESDVDKPGIILDYDRNGRLVGLEILDASKQVADLTRVQFNVAV